MKTVLKENLKQLADLLTVIPESKYKIQLDVLSGSSIGQHIRHILEFYQILVNSGISGTISYDKRKRDKNIEISPAYAVEAIELIVDKIDLIDQEMPLNFEADFTETGLKENCIKSSMSREMAYCIEHSIHHQAIIKAGLITMNLHHIVDDNFGVAYSTIRFRNKVCAQ